MMEYHDKFSVHQTLIKPIKLFGFPKVKDKIEALRWLSLDADIGDIEYVFPLVFIKNTKLASFAAQIVSGIMKGVEGKAWNNIYDKVKYTKADKESLIILLAFPADISVHLLGIVSLNSSGYVREKALKLIAGMKNSSAVPYILLRLNDWVLPVRSLAEHILKNMFTADNINFFIDNLNLINKLQETLRVDLKNTKMEIEDYLKDDSFKDEIKSRLRHPQVKTRLFCYKLLRDRIVEDESIINIALRDKSFEVRMWLVEAINILEPETRYVIIEKLLQDKTAKVKTAVLRGNEDIICLKFRKILERLVVDENASVRDEARFIVKKHSFIKDIPEFYRQQVLNNPIQGAIVGLGETGSISDFVIINRFSSYEESKNRLAALIAMWYLSKKDAVRYVLNSLDSDEPKIRRTAKRLLKGSKMPEILYEMKVKLRSEDLDTRVFALNIINGFGGWQALEGILFAISNEQFPLRGEAQNLLDCWLHRSSSLYTKPDSATKNTIVVLLGEICNKGLIRDKTLKELQFIIGT